MVLLRNHNGALPLTMTQPVHLLVIGKQAIKTVQIGRGSGRVEVNYYHTPLEALCDELGVPRVPIESSFYTSVGSNGNKVTFVLNTESPAQYVAQLEGKVFDASLTFLLATSGEFGDRHTLKFDGASLRTFNFTR